MVQVQTRRRGGEELGSALLEALIALAVLAMALLMMGPLLAIEADLGPRAEAHREGLAFLEAVVEAVRAGVVELEPGEVDLAELPMIPPSLSGLVLTVELDPDPAADDLWRLRLEANYRVRGARRSQHVTTLLWSPDA